ncbi:hypothetical protein HDU79_008793 [Rhizoclosmatium sp. JEL0117]|nr:hypothetical protein HDU79_008793 [Rhizoclosmatium sp. JEL0117]
MTEIRPVQTEWIPPPPIPFASVVDRAGMFGISTALMVMTILILRAIPIWWDQRTSIIKALNVVQIGIEWISYFLAVLFRFVNPRDICLHYRIFIDCLYYFGFTTAVEAMLLLKAQAMFTKDSTRKLVIGFGLSIAGARLGLGAATIAFVDYSSTYNPKAFTCFSKYDAFVSPAHSYFRIACDLTLSAIFLVPLIDKLLADGVGYPMAAFTVAFVITCVQMTVPAVGPFTQLLYAIVNSTICFSMHKMIENIGNVAKKISKQSNTDLSGYGGQNEAESGKKMSLGSLAHNSTMQSIKSTVPPVPKSGSSQPGSMHNLNQVNLD